MIGNICRSNPLPIVIPCYRVVSAKGVCGFCGETGGNMLKMKKWLLDHERRYNTIGV